MVLQRVFSNMITCIYTNTVIILSSSQLLEKLSLGMKMELTTILKPIFTCISYTVLGALAWKWVQPSWSKEQH